MFHIVTRAACGSVAVLLFSCTAIVNSKIDEFDSGSEEDAAAETDVPAEGDGEEEAGDVLPEEEDLFEVTDLEDADALDFDPDACGVWGTISVPDESVVGIDQDDGNRDGVGEMQIVVLYPTKILLVDSLDSATYPAFFSLDFNIREENYFCIPRNFFTDNSIEDGWIMPFIYDNPIVETSEPDDFLTFQSLIVDPLTIIIAAATYREADADRRALSLLYWNSTDSDNFMAIDLERRASKFTGSVDFLDFPDSGGVNRRARLCVTVYGVREPDWYIQALFPGEILGYNFVDLDDADVELNPPSFGFNVDFAANTFQQFLVHVKYIEGRSASTVFGGCGDETRVASCAGACYSLAAVVGTTFTGSDPFTLGPPEGSPDPACTVDLETLCP